MRMKPELKRQIEQSIREGKSNDTIAKELHVPKLYVEFVRCEISPFMQMLEGRMRRKEKQRERGHGNGNTRK